MLLQFQYSCIPGLDLASVLLILEASPGHFLLVDLQSSSSCIGRGLPVRWGGGSGFGVGFLSDLCGQCSGPSGLCLLALRFPQYRFTPVHPMCCQEMISRHPELVSSFPVLHIIDLALFQEHLVARFSLSGSLILITAGCLLALSPSLYVHTVRGLPGRELAPI